jgi:hypothetical protein
MRIRNIPHCLSVIGASLVAAIGGGGVCLAQHGDVWLSHDMLNDTIAVGVVDEAGTTYTPGVRVFEGILTPDGLPFSPFDFSAADPGFRSAAGDLPPSQPIALTQQSLQVWNGSGLDPAIVVDFDVDLSGGFSTGGDGSIHEHPLFGLIDLTADSLPVPDGVYVAAFTASTAGVGTSDRIYFVLLKDDLIESESDAESVEGLLEDFDNGGPEPVFRGKNFAFFEEAVEFVVDAVPEPSSALLGGCAVLGLISARKRTTA